MKKISIPLILIIGLLVAAFPSQAQLGDTDISSFTVQNLGSDTASVQVTFYDESGTAYAPATLNSGQSNPFTLNQGESFEVYLPGIADLNDGRYSVVISADQQIAAIVNLVGQGTVNFNGSYSGFDAGATTTYLPSVVFNYYEWYSLISVQNVGSDMTDITVSIACEDGTSGTLTATDVPAYSSAHFDLETTTPTGFTGTTSCNGSAEVVSTSEPVVVVDNQTAPAGGNTQSFSGVHSGATTIQAPALYTNYYGWNASINIRKLGSGTTTVTTTYSDGGTSTCNLSDTTPGCLLYMPAEHPTAGYFGATIESTSLPIVAVMNAANSAQAQTYNGVSGGSGTVGIPSVMKSYYGWSTSFTCQNVSSTDTTIHIGYDGYSTDEYDTAELAQGESVEVYQPGESFLPDGHQGAVTVTANASGAEIACIVNFNNPGLMDTGDWSMSYNAFSQ